VRLVLATRNHHKLREFRGLLPGHEVVPLPDAVELPPETGTTFEENARAKAAAAAEATGQPAFADDSGIEAAGLGGAPGVRSARYAGAEATDEENLAKLLAEVPEADRRARYVCALAFVEPAGREEMFVGTCEGEIAAEPRGSGGFGYDPGFVPAEHPERTMAELAVEEKDAISHRGRAARKLAAWLEG